MCEAQYMGVCQNSVVQGVTENRVCFGNMFRWYVSGVCFGGMFRGYVSGVCFGGFVSRLINDRSNLLRIM